MQDPRVAILELIANCYDAGATRVDVKWPEMPGQQLSNRLGHGSAKWHTARVIARQRQSEEAQEGLRAFLEKRQPAWVPEERSEPR